MPTDWSASEKEFERACTVIPGGVNSPARAFGAVGGHPIMIESAQGPFLYDIQGNRYIDYIGSWGPMILGHRHPDVVDAVSTMMQKGFSYGAPTVTETELALKVVEAVPSIEMVRMVSSGTEATMSAIRLARGATHRPKIIKFAGCYHGHVDSLLVQAGSAATTLGAPSSPGVPAGAVQDTIVLPFNDIDAVKQVFDEQGTQIAGVIVEPVAGNMGLVAPLTGFLEGLRDLTRDHGALLIFDEVMTGFRLSYGGAQQRLGVTPDITALGKIIGGGMPVGAFGGKREVMQHILPLGKVFQAGTLSGNPLAMASGLATITQLQEHPPYAQLETASAKLEEGLDKAASDAGIPHQTARVGSMITLFFTDQPVTNYTQATTSNTSQFSSFFWNMLQRGVYWPCSQYEALFVSATHTDDLIEETIDAARDALAKL